MHGAAATVPSCAMNIPSAEARPPVFVSLPRPRSSKIQTKCQNQNNAGVGGDELASVGITHVSCNPVSLLQADNVAGTGRAADRVFAPRVTCSEAGTCVRGPRVSLAL